MFAKDKSSQDYSLFPSVASDVNYFHGVNSIIAEIQLASDYRPLVRWIRAYRNTNATQGQLSGDGWQPSRND